MARFPSGRLDRFHLLTTTPTSPRTRPRPAVLFELIASYERRSMLVTAHQPFGEWGKVFPDPAMTLAAIHRLVHHSTIFEINIDSTRTRGRGTKARATSANVICHAHRHQR
jgi:hypothetical protein